MKKILLLIILFVPFYFYGNEKSYMPLQDNSAAIDNFVLKNNSMGNYYEDFFIKYSSTMINKKIKADLMNFYIEKNPMKRLLGAGIVLTVCGGILILGSSATFILIGTGVLVWRDGWDIGGPVLMGILAFIGLTSLIIGIVFIAYASYKLKKSIKKKKQADIFMDIESEGIKKTNFNFGIEFNI